MSYNATRLTCFAIISALETDAREAILAADADHDLDWPAVTLAAARDRLERERINSTDGIDLLVQFLDFADSYQVLLANKKALNEALKGSLQSAAPRLQELVQVRNRVAHSRPMEIGDLALTTDVAVELVRMAPDEWRLTKETLDRLKKDSAFVLGLTVQLPADPLDEPQHNLPIPDFDETGFFGRGTELRRVKKALLGPYPVVSVLGDGGIGKTAIALKVAYDLLDTPDNPFEAIVWASAKSTTLTNSEISAISGAIQDSLGLFEAAAKELVGNAAKGTGDPMEDVLEYLEEFRILLILDNLETVTDKRLREFLLNLPNGSKVLLTSRIGLGIENPVKLEPLTAEESKRLLKALAGIRSVDVLKQLDDTAIAKLVDKLRGHPLYIKWLVAGVQAGSRPAELVNDNSLLLDFCMSNVWDKLSQSARTVLQSMQVARGQRNLGELAYLTTFPADRIQAAILELMTTNFVTMKYSAEGDLDGAFETGEFASQYLARHQPPSQGFRSQVSGRARELEELGRDLMAESRSDPFDIFTIDVRDRADVPTARVLRSAIRELRAGNYDVAFQYCGEAQTLSPTYGEVWRVQGLVNYYRRDLNAAQLDFQRAHEYADRSPVMAFHVANFLAEWADDAQGALVVLNQGLRANPNNPSLLFTLGEVNFRLGNYRESVGACSLLAAIPQAAVSAHENAILCLRAAVFGTEHMLWSGNVGGAAELLEDTIKALNKIGIADMDENSADWIVHLRVLARRLELEVERNEFLARRAGEYVDTFEQRVRAIDPSRLLRQTGQLKTLDDVKRFGFIQGNGVDLFFHRNDLIIKDDWSSLSVNCLVAFEPLDRPQGAGKGPRAVRVRPLT